MNLRRHLFAAQLAHRVFQHPHVHIEADRVDMAVLLAAQQIARAAQFQIERRDLESRAQIAELLQRRQPLARDFRQLRIRLDEQIAIRPPVRPAHASAQLVELGQARSARRSR